MSDENENTGGVENASTEETNTGSLDTIRSSSALAALEGFGDRSTAEFVDTLKGDESLSLNESNQQNANEQPQGEQAGETAEATETEQNSNNDDGEEPNQEEEAAESGAEELVIESNIYGSESLTPEAKKEENKEKAPEQVSKFFKENDFGISEENFSTRIPELVEKEKQYEESAQMVENYKKMYSGMPLEMHDALVSFYNGESNWDRHIKERISLDFRKDTESLDVKEVVSKYFPGKLSDEDWEEFNDPEGDEKIKDVVSQYIAVSKSKFGTDQQSYNARIEEAKNSSKVYQENFQKSFDSSRSSLEQSFGERMPNVIYLDTIDQEIKSGMINDLYYHPDGTLKPDAHERYIMARDGRDLVDNQMEALKRAIATKEREQILERTTDSPLVAKTDSTVSTNEQERDQRVKDVVSSVLPEMNKSRF